MQQPMPHQLMGYDRAITMFSPDGRLLQVEYAKKTVHQGSTAMGMIAKDGVVLITDKRIVDKFIVPDGIEKIWQIDSHIGATASGILSDARVLIERAQLKAQQNRVTYDAPVDTLNVVKDIAALKQITTQSGGLRPFGVALIVAGVDETGPNLFETDPTGIYFPYYATVIGEAEDVIEELLKKEYKNTMNVDECIQLGIQGLMKALDKDFNAERIDAAYINTETKKFTRLTRDQISDVCAKIGKKK